MTSAPLALCLKAPGRGCPLQLNHVRELAACRLELGGRTLLGDHAVLQDHDLVRVLDRAHTVRDHDDGLAGEKAGKRLLHHGLVLDVQARRRLVQKDDGRVLEQAMEMRWHSPPESFEPFSPIMVS